MGVEHTEHKVKCFHYNVLSLVIFNIFNLSNDERTFFKSENDFYINVVPTNEYSFL